MIIIRYSEYHLVHSTILSIGKAQAWTLTVAVNSEKSHETRMRHIYAQVKVLSPGARATSYASDSQAGAVLLPREHLPMSGNIMVTTGKGATDRQRPGMLLNML